ncbi:MAG: hypothetical protein OHK0046_16980 [Anaerolineae bacterium]
MTTRTDYIANTPARSVDIHNTNVLPRRIGRFSWGAIFAGITIALVTMVALNALGLAIGAATVNPAVEATPIDSELGTGAIIWFAASNLLALFVGGYVAGHLSGAYDEVDGVLHGLVTWAVVSLISLFLLTSSVGSLFNTVTTTVSSALNTAGSVIGDVSPEVAQALNLESVTLEGIRSEVNTLLQQTGDPALQPSELEETAEQAEDVAQSTAQDIAQNPSLAGIEINRALNTLFSLDTIEEADRQDVINIITERTDLTEEEARQTLNRWETTLTTVRTDLNETVEQVSQDVADAVTVLAGVAFMAFVVGAFAGGAGGLLGTPKHDPLVDEDDAVVATT